MAGTWCASTTAAIWTVWAATSGTTTSASAVWPTWCEATSGTETADTSAVVWWKWNSDAGYCQINARPRYQEITETDEQRKAREDRLRADAEDARNAAEMAKAAQEKAERLLQEHLDEDQRRQHAAEKRFFLVAQSGKRYEVDCQRRQHNVYEVDAAGKRLIEYCIYQRGDCPLPDNTLAQKLLLEHDEPAFLRIANARRLAVAV